MPTARSLEEIALYHRRSVIALRILVPAFASHAEKKERAPFPADSDERYAATVEMRKELDDEVVLAMVASAERVLRLDFAARRGEKSDVGTRFAHLLERFETRVPLDEIVDVWKDLADASGACGAFKQLYVYRHGLAHGRYFNKSGLHHTKPEDAAAIIEVMFDEVRGHAVDFPAT